MANELVGDVSHDLFSLLSTEDRDFLIRNNGDQVRSLHTHTLLKSFFFPDESSSSNKMI